MRPKAFGDLLSMQKKDAFFDLLKVLIRSPSVVGAEHSFSVSCSGSWRSAGPG
ncbi:hypothetical protein [Microbulbifer taiwanensis]|uniref:hypothetical protein n=1 Tax=Microbulbifer taiwanensis TaxID=986746 RepID=UPI0036077F18